MHGAFTSDPLSLLPLSVLSALPNSHGLFMPPVRTTMAHTRFFAYIGPSLLNHLPPPLCQSILSAPLSLSLSFSLTLSLTFFWIFTTEML